MISRVFVANRGEIALRILTTCGALGIETVLGASEPDLEGPAARLADRVVCIGPAPAGASYLRAETVLAAALATGCDALHPGYGFLSESAAFARLTTAEGVRFIGPDAGVIDLTGDKLRARVAAREAGLELVPGRELTGLADAEAFARETGYPLLLKAAAGGGGRGIKLVHDASELPSVFDVASAEASAAFSDGRLYAERYITAARHIEVQLAGDAHGTVVHLGERDCSTQRRFQKLVEETPAPGIAAETRDAMCEAAVAFARSLSYTNLGTVEFIYDVKRASFAFLEMNCRIQVEHPVTEAVTGRDLIGEQLNLAAGEPLSFSQSEIAASGHAIECRLAAEDPARGFAPSPGRLTHFTLPSRPGLRIDTNCESGTLITPHYDSLIAKLIAHGRNREAARERLLEGLEHLDVQGVPTNRALLERVLADPAFVAGDVTTAWLEELVP